MTTSRTKPKVVQLTAPGRGAIASLRIEGPDAVEPLARVFRRSNGQSLAGAPIGQIVVGRIRVSAHPSRGTADTPAQCPTERELSEQIVVCRHSATSVELHCHGGHAAVSRILHTLTAGGCQPIPWTDWARDQGPNPTAAAARVAISRARTVRTAAVLLDQLNGALHRSIEGVERLLRAGDRGQAGEQLVAILAHVEVGRHLVEPWRVVLAGPSNVGKSSLINALMGYRRAIVDPTPGTTRDIVSATTALDGWSMQLADTAGLRPSAEPIERAGIETARQQASAADLVVLVFDASCLWSDACDRLVETYPLALRVHNKGDLPPATSATRPHGLSTSASTGNGIDELGRAIVERLVPHPPVPGTPVPFTEFQILRLRAAAEAASRGQLDEALASLAPLLR